MSPLLWVLILLLVLFLAGGFAISHLLWIAVIVIIVIAIIDLAS